MDDVVGLFNAFIDTKQPEVAIVDQKKYIVDKLNVLSIADKKDVAEAVVLADQKHLLKQCSEGIIVNLDKLTEPLISRMYDLVKHKIENRK